MVTRLQILLVGEQPVPNLLLLRFLRAERNILVCSERTWRQAENLQRLAVSETYVGILSTSAYDPVKVREDIVTAAASEQAAEVMVNLTGGTKLMALGAFLAAQTAGWPCLYLESETGRALLRRFRPTAGMAEEKEPTEVPPLCTIEDYLKVHGIWNFHERGPRHPFEQQVCAAVGSSLDEIKQGVNIAGQLELDLIFRAGNNFGVAEIKTGKGVGSREAIDQLSTATAREFLGTYTRRAWIVDRPPHLNNRMLADERGIRVIELPSGRSGQLSDDDTARLVTELLSMMAPPAPRS